VGPQTGGKQPLRERNKGNGVAVCPFEDRPSTSRRGIMPDKRIYDEASDIDAEDGVVSLKGPDAVDVRLTPDAAEETSERLNTGAMKARGQRYFSDRDK
jgi:hypothetical protein